MCKRDSAGLYTKKCEAGAAAGAGAGDLGGNGVGPGWVRAWAGMGDWGVSTAVWTAGDAGV